MPISLSPKLHLPPACFSLRAWLQHDHHLLATATATPPRREKRQRTAADARPLPGASTYSNALSIPAVQSREPRSSGGPGSRRVSNVLLFQLHGDGVEENVAAVAAAGVEGVSHCRSVTDRAAHTPSLVPMGTTGRAKHAVGCKEEADGRDGRGGLHVWTPCVQKGDFESPCGDRCGKGSHICMAPMHPKQKGRAYARRKGVSTPWSSYN